MLCEFPGSLDFQVSESWRQGITVFQLEAPYLSDGATVSAEDVSMSRTDHLLGILRAHRATGAGAAKLGGVRGCVACLPSF